MPADHRHDKMVVTNAIYKSNKLHATKLSAPIISEFTADFLSV